MPLSHADVSWLYPTRAASFTPAPAGPPRPETPPPLPGTVRAFLQLPEPEVARPVMTKGAPQFRSWSLSRSDIDGALTVQREQQRLLEEELNTVRLAAATRNSQLTRAFRG